MHGYKLIIVLLLGSFSSAAWGQLCQGHYWTEVEAKVKMQEFSQLWNDQNSWEKRADAIKSNLKRGLQWDKIPSFDRPQTLLISAPVSMDGYQVQNIALETFPGFYVTGNLYLPLNGAKKHPAVLSPHGHMKGGRFSEDVQLRCALLAKMGAVVFAYDMVGYGESTQLNHKMPISLLLQTWNSKAIIDYLVNRDDVDPLRIGVTGASGGGTQSFMIAALDPRVSVSVPVVQVSAHFFGGCACESGMPVHKNGAFQTNNVEIAAAFAPRPQLIVSDGADWTKNTPEVEFPYLQSVYNVFGKNKPIENVHLAEEQHNYGPSKRIAAYDFLAKHLGLSKNTVQENGQYKEDEIQLLDQEILEIYKTYPQPEGMLQGDQAIMDFLNINKIL